MQSDTTLFKVSGKDILPRSLSMSVMAEKCRRQSNEFGRSLNTAIRVVNATPKQMLNLFDYLLATTTTADATTAGTSSFGTDALYVFSDITVGTLF